MTRPQIQEEAITQLAELLQDKMQPDGLAIVMEADHYCMQWRGVKDMDSKMVNSVMRGSFLKDATHVFFFPAGYKLLEGVDPATFEVLRSSYYRDKDRVYCTGFQEGFVEGADLPSFEELPPQHPSRGDAWDRNWIYRGKDQPAQLGKEQTILIGNMWGFGQKKPQAQPPAQPQPKQ